MVNSGAQRTENDTKKDVALEIIISFIVPVHRVEEYLPACVESLCRMEEPALEFILVDDGSPDKCGALCDSYAEKDARIRVLHQENAGVAAARNAGIAMARGRWVCFVDGDDSVDARLAGALAPWLAGNADVLFFAHNEQRGERLFLSAPTCENGAAFGRAELEWLQRAILNFKRKTPYDLRALKPGVVWGKCIRTEFLKACGTTFPAGFARGEDNLFCLELFEKAQTAVVCTEPLYQYRIHAESVSRRYNPRIYEINSTLMLEISRRISAWGEAERFAADLQVKAAVLGINCILLDYCNRSNPKPYKERRQGYLAMMASEPFQTAFQTARPPDFSLRERVIFTCAKRRMFGLMDALNRLNAALERLR